jgi:hypothetical protein
MTITLETLSQYGIGNNFSATVYPQDFQQISYGADLEENLVLTDPTTNGGSTPWFKEPSYDRWWKVGPKGEAEE